jgi:hypothetical protein
MIEKINQQISVYGVGVTRSIMCVFIGMRVNNYNPINRMSMVKESNAAEKLKEKQQKNPLQNIANTFVQSLTAPGFMICANIHLF